MDIEAEIHNLKRRVGDLEGAVNVLTGQISAIQPNIVALRDQSTESFNRVEGLIGRLVARVDTLNSQVWSLRDDLPELMNAALRESRTRND
jgi:predicted  nucleic acid-binding Zn-ribbon protein